jgi:protein AbiQ
MELYEVTVEYVKYLRKFEPTKIMSNADGKEQRKFLGVIVQKIGEALYETKNSKELGAI